MKNTPADLLNTRYNKSFCIKPFTEISNSATGERMLCCRSEPVIRREHIGKNITEDFFNHSAMHEIRRKMIAGELVKECDICLATEAGNGTSHRTRIMRKAMDEIPEIVDDIYQNGTVTLLSLDIRFGTKCNLACVMCGPGSSSLIAKEINHPQMEFDLNDFSLDQIKLHASEIRQFKTTGGEPMLLPAYKKTLEFLVESGHSEHIEFTTITNGTIDFTDMLPLMNKFKVFKVSISLDAADINYNYVRYPGTFSRVERIHKRITDAAKQYKNVELEFGATIHALNINQPVKIAKYLATIGCEDSYSLEYVRHPKFMQPGIVHIDTIEELEREATDWYNLDKSQIRKEILDFIALIKYNYTQVNEDQKYKQLLIKELTAKVDFWKRKRKLDAQDYVPHYSKILDQ